MAKQISNNKSDFSENQKSDLFSKILKKMDFKEVTNYIEEYNTSVVFFHEGQKYKIELKEVK